MHRKWLLILLQFTIFLSGSCLYAQDVNRHGFSAMDTSSIAELTLEELQFYQSDFFPLSLSENGRQSFTAWRGMPPQFLDYQFTEIRLVHPLWGAWDNQFVPIEIMRGRKVQLDSYRYQILPVYLEPTAKPVSRIAYSQDFTFGLSYLDVNLTRYYNPRSYVRLGGGNFLRTGTVGQFTAIQVNTYRGQVHHEFSGKVSLDVWYLQMRHRFRLGEFPYGGQIRRVHRIGQIGWLKLNFQPDSLHSIAIIPYGYKWGDRYKTETYSEHRKTELFSTGLKADYTGRFSWGKAELTSDFVWHEITEALHFSKKGEWQADNRLRLQWQWRQVDLTAGGGYFNSQDTGSDFIGEFGFKLEFPRGWKSGLYLAQEPRLLPLAALFWQDDSISNLKNPQLSIARGADFNLQFPLGNAVEIKLGSYYHQFLNSVTLNIPQARFYQTDIKNSGIFSQLKLNFWRLGFDNQLSYNTNYQESFIPQLNNIFKMKLQMALFKNALKLDGYMIYHYIGKWRLVEYDPLTNQYIRTGETAGEYHLLDFKVLAHIQTATLFFVWENVLSQDYEIIRNYPQFFRTFRLGLYWTLFN